MHLYINIATYKHNAKKVFHSNYSSSIFNNGF